VTTPLSVIREALLKPVPCPKCQLTIACWHDTAGSRVDAQADIVLDALDRAGMLAGEAPAAPSGAAIEEVAQFLARESHFARYTYQDGWRMLLTSEADISVAFAKAKAACDGSDREVQESLGRARDLLVAHVERRAAGEQR
jgi:hypothetical protein